MLDPQISLHFVERIEREIEPGEKIVWSGMPTPAFFTGASIAAFLMGIPWTAFAIFWTVAAAWGTWNVNKDIGLFSLFPLFGIPFVLIGLFMLSTPIWTYYQSFYTVYVMTNRRAIIIEGKYVSTIRSFFPENMSEYFRRERRDGSGDLVLTRQYVPTRRRSRNGLRLEESGFFRIADVKDVELLLKSLIESSRSNAVSITR